MGSDFDQYIASEPSVLVSTDDEAMLVWGEKAGDGASLLGYSYNTDARFQERGDTDPLRMLKTMADGNGVPLLWIGKSRFSSGYLQLGQVRGDQDTGLELDGGWVELSDAGKEIQGYLGTDYEVMGTAKERNKRTAGGFHDWSRTNLPEDFKKQDLDIVVTSDGVHPRYVIELKRSYYHLDDWSPWRDDLRNYHLQAQAASGNRALPLIVYQNKEPISDDSLSTLFKILDLSPGERDWITTERENKIQAIGLKRRLISGNLGL
jgi:hypothetical protein